MRLEAKAKGGYYPCPHEALDMILPRLIMPTSGQPVSALDPCAGGGLAFRHIAIKLGIPFQQCYAVELEGNRSEELAENLPGANILAPCSFFGARIAHHSLSLLYANPPFDDSGDGSGRVEQQFLDRGAPLLKKDGVLLMVCPERVSWKLRRSLLTRFDNIVVTPFPEEHRRFEEVFILAVKRARPADPDTRHWDETGWIDTDSEAHANLLYHIPVGSGPQEQFRKSALTPQELRDHLSSSPLLAMLEPPPEPPLPSPPLELGTGHLALLLAAGQLDGLVSPEGEEPHCVRGTVKKIEELASVEVDETEKSVRTVTTMVERISMSVRVVGPDGIIKTLE